MTTTKTTKVRCTVCKRNRPVTECSIIAGRRKCDRCVERIYSDLHVTKDK